MQFVKFLIFNRKSITSISKQADTGKKAVHVLKNSPYIYT